MNDLATNIVASILFLVGYEFLFRPLSLYLRSRKIAGDYVVCNPLTRQPLSTGLYDVVHLTTSFTSAGMFDVEGTDNVEGTDHLGQSSTRSWKGSLRFDPIALEFASGQYNYTQGDLDAGWHSVIKVIHGKEYLVQTTAIHFPLRACFLWRKKDSLE